MKLINTIKNKYAYLFLISILVTNKVNAASQWGAPPKPSNVPEDFEVGLMNLTNWILGFVSIIATLMVIWGGVLYLTSAGDESKAETGKKTISYAFIGLVIVGLAYSIINTIVTKVLE